MPLSKQTTERLQSLKRRAEEIMQALGVPEDRAWQMMSLDATQRAAETAERWEAFQKKQADARRRADAAANATYNGVMKE